jgi:hypothetical protein
MTTELGRKSGIDGEWREVGVEVPAAGFIAASGMATVR